MTEDQTYRVSEDMRNSGNRWRSKLLWLNHSKL